jgi:predicted nucleotidyltransferase component of viral defense system
MFIKLSTKWRGQGGTAIRKIYFPEWHFSENMDFTTINKVDPQNLKQGFEDWTKGRDL